MASKEDNSKDATSLDEKRSPNCLIIVDVTTDYDKNYSIIYLSLAKMKELSLFHGDTVLVSGENGRDIVCNVLEDKTCDDSKVCLSEYVRKKIRVNFADTVSISRIADDFAAEAEDGMAHLHVPICMCKVACADFAHAKNFACAKPYPNIRANTHTNFCPKILHGQNHTLT